MNWQLAFSCMHTCMNWQLAFSLRDADVLNHKPCSVWLYALATVLQDRHITSGCCQHLYSRHTCLQAAHAADISTVGTHVYRRHMLPTFLQVALPSTIFYISVCMCMRMTVRVHTTPGLTPSSLFFFMSRTDPADISTAHSQPPPVCLNVRFRTMPFMALHVPLLAARD